MPPITSITAVPAFVSPEEHKALVESTPASFNDIPPVLRHKQENVSVRLDPPLDGFATAADARGTLYVIESVLVFVNDAGRAFQVEYPAITLHAISRADPRPSIYCQLDESAPQVDGEGAAGGEGAMRELSIIPQSASALEPIFEALSLCASLHPDPDPDDDMDDDDGDAFIDAAEEGNFEVFTGGEGEELSEVGRAALEHLESIIYDPHNLTNQADGINGDDPGSEGKQEGSEGRA
ncbi:hypothetical protein GLOTRDRAFT_62865 [Gloeophyllum trabeum ATCC 11539]|uniref:Regulator of volume decrease after cellular swelling-domain-containing protein n=1 Tax=Gloeophyllum trabeum (strain ATCC 11539 / FP-39264 / Madison 617) TaxID=670483 RepID=S7Q2T9_GLOTA|nr:uncharacterized protein GLOTRDRAFT_62865 [Gloeophyllum trabeum ATCC 11539]EPQ54311.1 hypothetical protein GLOTRDRAFT_62865 [Gloeophyllum trabeum ATCC 11539]